MIGTLGRDSDCGELSRRSAWNCRPLNASSAAALALPHPVRDLERLLEHLEPLAERREREAEARDSSSFQAAPMPSQARPPDRTSSVVAAFTHRPGFR